MSMVKIKNVSRDKGPLYCNLKDGTSLALQYGQSKTVSDELLTNYIQRRASLGHVIITQAKSSESSEMNVAKSKGKKKPTTENSNNKEV